MKLTKDKAKELLMYLNFWRDARSTRVMLEGKLQSENEKTCPFCRKLTLIRHFDGEQSYITCKNAVCDFDALLGDGDLT